VVPALAVGPRAGWRFTRSWRCSVAPPRFLAEQLSGGPDGSLADFATGPSWDQSGRPNYIGATEPTDQNPISIGCGIVYLYWMLSKGYTAAQITQAGCPDGTLASNYQALTGAANAWAAFSAAVNALPGGITSDNPWGAIQPPPTLGESNGKISIDPDAKVVTVPAGWWLAPAAKPAGCSC
jgi:hypothetical protein